MLVRNKEKGEKLASEYPNVRVVQGDLDSAAIIEEETKNADIVFREYIHIPILLNKIMSY